MEPSRDCRQARMPPTLCCDWRWMECGDRRAALPKACGTTGLPCHRPQAPPFSPKQARAAHGRRAVRARESRGHRAKGRQERRESRRAPLPLTSRGDGGRPAPTPAPPSVPPSVPHELPGTRACSSRFAPASAFTVGARGRTWRDAPYPKARRGECSASPAGQRGQESAPDPGECRLNLLIRRVSFSSIRIG